MPDVTDLGPATPSVAHKRQEKAATVLADVFAGTFRLREKRETYLPRMPKEAQEVYNLRTSTSDLFNATRRTIEAFSGMVFRKPIEYGEEIDPRILDAFDDIDLCDRGLSEFAQEHFVDALRDGHAHILVDMEPAPKDVETREDEIRAGLRPYWVHVPKMNVVGYEVAKVGGKKILVGIRIRETTTRRDGYREFEVEQIRELRTSIVPDGEPNAGKVRVKWRIWELDPETSYPGEAKDWSIADEGWMSRPDIPIATTYTGRKAYFESDPPFLDLALTNIRHFQTDSDNQNLARTSKVATLVFSGVAKKKIEGAAVGAGFALVVENPDAKVAWISADGSNFEVFLDDLERVERRMAVMGLSMLYAEPGGDQTATQRRIDKSETDSFLAKSAKNLQAGLNAAVGLHADWIPELEEPGGEIAVNMDFVSTPLDPQVVSELRALWAERGISWETLVGELVRGEWLPDSFDAEAEKDQIAAEDADRMEREASAFGRALEGLAEEEDENDDNEPEETDR